MTCTQYGKNFLVKYTTTWSNHYALSSTISSFLHMKERFDHYYHKPHYNPTNKLNNIKDNFLSFSKLFSKFYVFFKYASKIINGHCMVAPIISNIQA